MNTKNSTEIYLKIIPNFQQSYTEYGAYLKEIIELTYVKEYSQGIFTLWIKLDNQQSLTKLLIENPTQDCVTLTEISYEEYNIETLNNEIFQKNKYKDKIKNIQKFSEILEKSR